ncbi:MAG: type II toxin-antitoxin system HicA family toxin [Anaerolineae bacterium]|nr:type II toxin-antitoxin system HicA family toxin [Anaerolineae bacterium]
MGKYPVLKPREVVAILEKLGFVEVRQRGSHKQYRHPDGRSTVVKRCINPVSVVCAI